ncbi:hypothetical protein CRENBAI_025115 [Crenichthys baileyi]|uniref:Uncharacterized protein n=1 Tax=Crenichthys baileyi TaxID=28760 RepID=A0AAV9SMT5_9TELE
MREVFTRFCTGLTKVNSCFPPPTRPSLLNNPSHLSIVSPSFGKPLPQKPGTRFSWGNEPLGYPLTCPPILGEGKLKGGARSGKGRQTLGQAGKVWRVSKGKARRLQKGEEHFKGSLDFLGAVSPAKKGCNSCPFPRVVGPGGKVGGVFKPPKCGPALGFWGSGAGPDGGGRSQPAGQHGKASGERRGHRRHDAEKIKLSPL